MCTSFIKKTEGNYLLGMNFDNNGMEYSISTKKKDWFIIYISTGKIKVPSFGVHKSGIFFNNLCVEENEKGKYRRSSNVTHTSKFLLGIIDGKIDVEDLDNYLSKTEIVNVPDWSTHNMISTKDGNVWIIEPGRGNIYKELKDSEFQVMTNFSILDLQNEDDISCERYKKVKEILKGNDNFTTKKAFELLKEVKQNGEEWTTDFSFVFDKSKNTVYYVEKQNLDSIKEYLFM
mgnify:CR=1 FL=1